jgi:molybdopterin-containing oxidoreductase family membrane subunit
MKAVYALYSEPDDAQRAVEGLRAAGVAERDITIVSGEPIEHHPLGARDHETWMFWIASGGGIFGLAFATWLTRMTQLAWPIPTGNMPIVAWWPNLIIMFELTMLGGIIATVVTLLVSGGLPSRGPKLYDPAVMDGKILVGVQNPPSSSISAIERALGGRVLSQ